MIQILPGTQVQWFAPDMKEENNYIILNNNDRYNNYRLI